MPIEAPDEEVAPPLRDGRYRLREVLGEGGMAVVYRAWDSRLEVERAVKVLLPAMAERPRIRARFHAEARTMARLSHPHIVPVHDVDADGDRVYIVMELLRGGTLWSWVERRGPMPPRVAVDGLLPVLSALHAAHARGVVHRDVKPQNVLLTADGVPKMSDFGIARIEDGDLRTRTAAVMGTWTYMPPEQRNSAKDCDARADLYAAGAMLWALLRGLDPPDLFAADMDPALLDGLPAPLAEVVRRATRYRRDDRYASATEMAEALHACRDALQPSPAELEAVGPTPAGAVLPVSAFTRASMAETDEVPKVAQLSPAEGSSPDGPPAPADTVELDLPSVLAESPAEAPAHSGEGRSEPAQVPEVDAAVEPDSLLDPEPEWGQPRPSRLPLVLGGLAAASLALALGMLLQPRGDQTGASPGAAPLAAVQATAAAPAAGGASPAGSAPGAAAAAPRSAGAATASTRPSASPAASSGGAPTDAGTAAEDPAAEAPAAEEPAAEAAGEALAAEAAGEALAAEAPAAEEPAAEDPAAEAPAAEDPAAEAPAAEASSGTTATCSVQRSGPSSRVVVEGEVYSVSIVDRDDGRRYSAESLVPPGCYSLWVRFPDQQAAAPVLDFSVSGGWTKTVRCEPRDHICQ